MNIRKIPHAIMDMVKNAAGARKDPVPWDLLRYADDARDRRQYLVAAELYDQVLRAGQATVDLLLQCGHMHKEARSFADAQARYLQAFSLAPKNAEVLLQLGHF